MPMEGEASNPGRIVGGPLPANLIKNLLFQRAALECVFRAKSPDSKATSSYRTAQEGTQRR